MESSNEKGRFPKTSKNFVLMLVRVKGTLVGKMSIFLLLPPNVIIMLVLNSLTS
jgi:hypothetical protein